MKRYVVILRSFLDHQVCLRHSYNSKQFVRYINRLARHPVLRKDPDFRSFLQENKYLQTFVKLMLSHASIYLYIYLSIYLSISIYLSSYIYLYVHTYLSIHIYLRLSFYIINQSIYIFIFFLKTI